MRKAIAIILYLIAVAVAIALAFFSFEYFCFAYDQKFVICLPTALSLVAVIIWWAWHRWGCGLAWALVAFWLLFTDHNPFHAVNGDEIFTGLLAVALLLTIASVTASHTLDSES